MPSDYTFQSFFESLVGEQLRNVGSDGNVLIRCWNPYHEDRNDSLDVSVAKGVYLCHGCNIRGNVFDAYRHFHPEATDAHVREVLQANDAPTTWTYTPLPPTSSLPDPDPIAWSVVDECAAALAREPERVEWLRERRGLTEDTIQRFHIGWSPERGRYTIPIINAFGDVANIRCYKPDAAELEPKMVSWNDRVEGRGQLRLYPLDVLQGASRVVLCEGELDAILANQMGFPAVTSTGGASNFNPRWAPLFTNKAVYVAYDNDMAGKMGARAVTRYLTGKAAEVVTVELPVGLHEDVTDYFVKHGHNSTEFRALLSEATTTDLGEGIVGGSVSEVLTGGIFAAGMVRVPMHVASLGYPHVVPCKVQFDCEPDAASYKPCAHCTVAHTNEHAYELPVYEGDTLLRMYDLPEKELFALMGRMCGVPLGGKGACGKVQVSVIEWTAARQMWARAPVSGDGSVLLDSNYAMCVVPTKVDVQGSREYDAICEVYRHPKSGMSVPVIREATPLAADLDTFFVDDTVKELLAEFRVQNRTTPWWDVAKQRSPFWTLFQSKLQAADLGDDLALDAVTRRLFDITTDLEQNVTRIFGRPELHIAYDLTYHSVLDFMFGDVHIDRGWMDMMCLGDTRTGKSEVAKKLRALFEQGSMVSAEVTSFAGMFGGLQQLDGKTWSVTWGSIPQNDRRLVVIDEADELDVDDMSQLSSVRSEGVARLTKIRQEEAISRTRLIWCANPRSGRAMNQHTFGIEALLDTVPRREDIARFDLCVTASHDELNTEAIHNLLQHNSVQTPGFSQTAQEASVLFAWSRDAYTVDFTDEAEDEAFEQAIRQSHMYSQNIPVAEAMTQRNRLARIAVAVATRLYSTDGSGEIVRVLPEHVRFAAVFLDTLYDKPSCGFLAYSKAHEPSDQEEQERAARFWIQGNLAVASFINVNHSFNRQDLSEFTGSDGMEVTRSIIRPLMLTGLIDKTSRGYKKTPVLIKVLRELGVGTVLRPAFPPEMLTAPNGNGGRPYVSSEGAMVMPGMEDS